MKKWTEEEITYLKNNYGRMRVKDLQLPGRTKVAMQNKAHKLNITGYRQWSKKDEDYLMDSWGTVSMATIAKKLSRTKGAVQQKASKLGLGAFLEAGEYVSLNQLYVALRGLNQGGYTVKQWIDKGLPVRKRKVKNCSFKVVYLPDFWDWAEMNSTLIDFSRLEKNTLGAEPKWLEEQRKADQELKFYKSTPWTKEEDETLRSLLNAYRYTYRELAFRLRRTEGAIKRRMIDLGIKARPLKMSNHNPWTRQEVEILKDLYFKGHTPNTITNYIPGRSAQACSGKIERLIKEGELFPRSEYRVSC